MVLAGLGLGLPGLVGWWRAGTGPADRLAVGGVGWYWLGCAEVVGWGGFGGWVGGLELGWAGAGGAGPGLGWLLGSAGLFIFGFGGLGLAEQGLRCHGIQFLFILS